MAFMKLVSCIYDLMQFRLLQLQIKEAATSNMVQVDASSIPGAATFESPMAPHPLWDSEVPAMRFGEICCVCLSRLKVGGQDLRILPCLHEFHEICIRRWFDASRRTCPVCRSSLEEERMSCKTEVEFTEEMVTWFSSFHVADL